MKTLCAPIVLFVTELAKPNRLAAGGALCYIHRPNSAVAMLINRRRRQLAPSAPLAAALLAALVGGCADGPVPEMRRLNPWVRKAWDEDEQRITTYHRKIKDLAELRQKAPRMPPAERDETAGDLAARLKEEKSAVLRAEFIRTLAAFPTPVAQDAVLSGLNDPDASVRVIACKALGQQPNEAGFQALSHLVTSDNDLDVRIVAVRELGKFRGFAAPQALRPALDDRDPALQLAAIASLEGLEGHAEYRRSVAAWRQHLDGGTPTPPEGPSIAELVRQYWSWF